MSKLASVYSKVFGPADKDHALEELGAGTRVPAFANDDIYFFVKRIDNRSVVRAADPVERGTCWKLIGSVVAAAVLLIGVLLPSTYGLLAGYQIQSLRREGQRLAIEQASLELNEARLLSPARMEELARIQRFVDPEPEKVVYLDGTEVARAQK